MKNKIYLFLLLALIGWNCSDKTEAVPAKTKHEVSFSISGISSAAPLKKQQSLTASSLFDEVAYVNLYLYNSRGYLVGEYSRQNGMSSSVFVASLEEGSYTAVAVGSGGGVYFLNAERLQTARILKYQHGQDFMDKVEFEVSPSETGTVELKLQRKVGMLDLDITDEAGSDIEYVNVKMDAMAYEFTFRDFMAFGTDHQYIFRHFPHVEDYTDFPAYFYVPYNSESYKTTITLELITYGQVSRSIVLKDVTVGFNRKTTIRGKLYNSGPQDFAVEIDDEWSGEDTIDF